MEKKHSADYFCETRDDWWNSDFLELISKRWKLHTVNTALDVGCGIGYWGMLLSKFLNHKAQLIGIDQEKSWIEQASRKSKEIKNNCNFHYTVAQAENLPFKDNYFDFVTCQTVLIHMKEPSQVLNELREIILSEIFSQDLYKNVDLTIFKATYQIKLHKSFHPTQIKVKRP